MGSAPGGAQNRVPYQKPIAKILCLSEGLPGGAMVVAMKIERIDEKTVKCFISNEELEEYDVTYKDFVMRSEKAKEMVEDIIGQAEEEVGYKPPQFALDLQIMLLPSQGMILTFSEKSPEEVKGAGLLMEYLKEVRKILSGEDVEKAPQLPQGEKQPDSALFGFRRLGDVCEYTKALPKNLRVESSLYVQDGIYYLYIQKGNASYKRYSRACIHALEFGALCSADPEQTAYLLEHGECLLAQRALQKLRF